MYADNPIWREALGRRIRSERERLGLNIIEAAERLHISRSSQINYETGKTVPTIAFLLMFAELGADFDGMVGRAPRPPSTERGALKSRTVARLYEILGRYESENLPVAQQNDRFRELCELLESQANHY